MPPPARVDFKRWPFYKRWFGARAERAAARHLRRAGHRVLAANVADRLGELDLLTLDAGTLVVVEVRSTSTADPQLALDSVNFPKQRRVCEAAARFLARRRLLGLVPVRFDVVAVSWPPDKHSPTILHVVQAFDATGRFEFFT